MWAIIAGMLVGTFIMTLGVFLGAALSDNAHTREIERNTNNFFG